MQLITIIDSEDPIILCPDDQIISTDILDCSVAVNGIAPTVTDNCQLKNTTYTIFHNGSNLISGFNNASGAIFPLGSSMVTYLATDDCGNEATCSFAVTVVDDVLPVFTLCPIKQSTIIFKYRNPR